MSHEPWTLVALVQFKENCGMIVSPESENYGYVGLNEKTVLVVNNYGIDFDNRGIYAIRRDDEIDISMENLAKLFQDNNLDPTRKIYGLYVVFIGRKIDKAEIRPIEDVK